MILSPTRFSRGAVAAIVAGTLAMGAAPALAEEIQDATPLEAESDVTEAAAVEDDSSFGGDAAVEVAGDEAAAVPTEEDAPSRTVVNSVSNNVAYEVSQPEAQQETGQEPEGTEVSSGEVVQEAQGGEQADQVADQVETLAESGTSATSAQQLNGLVTDGGATYYYRDGNRVTGQVYDGATGGWYYFDEGTGAMVKGWKDIADQGKTVYYDQTTGKMTYGESQVANDDAAHDRRAGWYLFDATTGAVRESSMEFMERGRRWVYFTSRGLRASGEVGLNDDQGHNGWYYFDGDNDGAMVHGFWNLEDGRTVYYDAVTGIMHHGESYLNDSSGDGWRYFDDLTGEMATGFTHLSQGDKTVYYDPSNGVMAHGEAYLSGPKVTRPGWYHFDEVTGSMTSGWKQLGDKTVYYYGDGLMSHGWLVLSGNTYYTDPVTGALVHGERFVDADGDGHVVGWYHFNDTNATLDTGWKYFAAAKKWVYYDPATGAMVHADFTQDGVTYHVDAVTGAISNATAVRIRAAMQWMCDIAYDPSHGYDWSYRWGERGDYDCSSLVISALRQAGFDTGSATYTGNMRSNLTARGFRWITDVSQRQAGDILLNETYHTAMYLGNEWLVQASGNENGGVYGGQPGDQTGKEIYERNYYTYGHGGWDGLLRYVG